MLLFVVYFVIIRKFNQNRAAAMDPDTVLGKSRLAMVESMDEGLRKSLIDCMKQGNRGEAYRLLLAHKPSLTRWELWDLLEIMKRHSGMK